jgi:hypothetical protein
LEGKKYFNSYLILSPFKIQGEKKGAGRIASPLGIYSEAETSTFNFN